MSPETQDFLDGLRSAEDPTADDQRRVLEAVCARVAGGNEMAGKSEHSRERKRLVSAASFAALLVVLMGVAVAFRGKRQPDVANQPGEVTAEALPIRRGPSQGITPVVPRAQSEPIGSDEQRQRVERHAPARQKTTMRSGVPSLRAELDLLAEVQAALKRGDGEAALKKLDAHETRDARLLAERRVARILALCAAGREDEARRAAAEFAQQHPGSVHQHAVSASCGRSGAQRGTE